MNHASFFPTRSFWRLLLAGWARTYGPLPEDSGPEAVAADWRAIGEDLYAAMVDAAAVNDDLRLRLADQAGTTHDRLMELVPAVTGNEDVRRDLIGAARQQKRCQTALLSFGSHESAG